jgi:lysophospholipase L1-like esterase
MKILVLGIFPRAGKGIAKEAKMAKADELNTKVPATNKILSKLDDGKTVFYKDISKEFLDKDGNLPKEIMPDYLHLSAKGYDIWGKAIKGDLEKLTK